MATGTKLTVEDLHDALNDDRHDGWGYATADDAMSGRQRDRLDRAVVAVANELNMDYDALFHWSNSKHGRWLVDNVGGGSDRPTRTAVRRHLNKFKLEGLAEEGVLIREQVTAYEPVSWLGRTDI